MARDEDHRQIDAHSREFVLKRQSAHPRQSHIEHETARDVRLLARQELLSEANDRTSSWTEPRRPSSAGTHRWVIVDDEDDRCHIAHDDLPTKTNRVESRRGKFLCICALAC